MKKIFEMFMRTGLLLAAALLVSACGGGGGGGATAPAAPPTTLSGKAAAGAPIIGSVTIKDSSSPAQTKTVPIAADGNYSVDVTGLKAPYMVRADGYVGGNDYHLYSAGTSADVGGTINITPLTDLIVANIAGSVAKTYFDNGSFSTLTATQLTAQSDALKAKLLPILTAVGVSGSIDLLRASFSTDHTGLDAALDVIRVNTTDAVTGAATITNFITAESVSSKGTTVMPLADPTKMRTAATDIQAITAGFKKFSDIFATSLPSPTNAALLALFDSATFMHDGQNLNAFLSKLTTEQSLIGVSFTNISILSMDPVAGTALVAFDVIQNGAVSKDGPRPFQIIKKSGVWYMQGDQRIAQVRIIPWAEYQPNSGNATKITTGLHINIEDRGGKGITSAVVTGKGLPAQGLTMVNQINYSWFTIQGNLSGNTYTMNDTQIAAIADTGEVYTVQLYSGTTLKATYTEKIKKRPYLNSELTAAMFPTITAPTVAQLHAFTGGTSTVSWTLPAGLTNDWLEATIMDNAGNSARIEFSLLPADRSKTGTLNPVTSTGQPFTITGGGIWLGAWDGFGRQLSLGYY